MDADTEVATWRCQVLGRLTAFQAWRKPGVGGWRGHKVSLEAILNSISFDQKYININ